MAVSDFGLTPAESQTVHGAATRCTIRGEPKKGAGSLEDLLLLVVAARENAGQFALVLHRLRRPVQKRGLQNQSPRHNMRMASLRKECPMARGRTFLGPEIALT